MAGLAQRLPVASVPEQLRVSAVRFYVIHDRGVNIPTVLKAFRAERMLPEISL